MHTICGEWTNEHMQVRTEKFSLNCGAHSHSPNKCIHTCVCSTNTVHVHVVTVSDVEIGS